MMAADAVNPELVRLSLFEQLIDWDASDLKRVYEPISWHFSCLFSVLVVVLGTAWVWGIAKRYWYSLPEYVQYCRVMNSKLVTDQAISNTHVKYRTCAVIGGNGFIGSHLVSKLLKTHSFRVYVLGRSIPKESERHPDVAGYIQVDMRDYDGLVRAFANVDTVFHLGAVIPNAFVNSPEAIWEGNRSGAVAVVGACKAAGVKNLIYLSVLSGTPQREHSFILSKKEASRIVLNAQGDNGLRTCVANASLIFGAGDKLSTTFVTGRMSIFPKLPNKFYFMYVGDLTQMLVQLEERLIANDDEVLGKGIDLPGEVMTFSQFFSLSEWNHRPPRFVHYQVIKFLSRVNTLCAKVMRCAPLGHGLYPQILNQFICPTNAQYSSDHMFSIFGLEQIPSVKKGIIKTVTKLTK
jgi:uncharacterized protein YbjT (DUF2867 family)